MKVLYKKKRAELETDAAGIISREVRSIKKKQINLAICGGTSVRGIFRALLKTKIPWKKVHIFMVDERLVPINHKDSNFKLAKDSFIDTLIKAGKLPAANVHPFELDLTKKDFGVQTYADLLKKQGGKFDIILLSSGEDNHIGALFPNHQAVKSKAAYFTFMTNAPKPPKKRMTASVKLISRAKCVLLLFFDPRKKEALNNFIKDCDSVYDCPQKIVKFIPKSFILTNIRAA